jgi:hypothetical protein
MLPVLRSARESALLLTQLTKPSASEDFVGSAQERVPLIFLSVICSIHCLFDKKAAGMEALLRAPVLLAKLFAAP